MRRLLNLQTGKFYTFPATDTTKNTYVWENSHYCTYSKITLEAYMLFLVEINKSLLIEELEIVYD